jgi:type II secretory pathway pseudopilin PulG
MAKGKKSGFTLNEIMMTTCIVGLLTTLAVPNAQQAIATARSNSCINNLRKIEAAKDHYALDSNVNQGITPANSDLDPYIRGGIQLAKQCPLKGAIAINPIGVEPSCSIAGHSLNVSLASGGNSTAVTGTDFASKTAVTGTAFTPTEVVPGGNTDETPAPTELPLTSKLPIIETPLQSSTSTNTSTLRGDSLGAKKKEYQKSDAPGLSTVSTVSTTPAIHLKFVFDPLTMGNVNARYNRRTGEYSSNIIDQQTGDTLYVFKAVLPDRSRSARDAAYDEQITIKQPP